MKTLLISALFSLLLASSASAQLNVTVGPTAIPIGGKMVATLSNDSPGKFGMATNLWTIENSTGQVVFQPNGSSAAILMGPGGAYTFTWDLRDGNGNLVGPGNYSLKLQSDLGWPVTTHPFRVTATGAGLVLKGTASSKPSFPGIGPRQFYLTSPSDPGQIYFLLASTSSTVGTPTCGGVVPLDPSTVLNLSLTPNLVFAGSLGFLNSKGETNAPSISIPNDPAFVGLHLEAAFVVLDPASTCIVRRISGAHGMTIL